MPRMLIVEDEQDIADCLQQFFSGQGFAVDSVFSGEEALLRIAQEGAEIVLLDILLPGLSGIEILRRVKATNPRARVIMVTALDRDELRLQAHHYGASGFVTKPFNFSKETWAPVYRSVAFTQGNSSTERGF